MTGDTGSVIGRLLLDLEKGREPDLEVLAAAYPDQAADLPTLLSAARQVLGQLPRGSQAPDLVAGDVLAGYVIEGPIACGGMGTVYTARQTTLGDRRVALKVVSSGLNPTRRARFEKEAELLADVHHPNLVEIYEHGESGSRPFIAMQLVEGHPLSELQRQVSTDRALGSSPAVIRQIVSWCAQVARALGRLHERRLVHRDVKPANIVIEGLAATGAAGLAGGRAVLVDFGLVRGLDEGHRTRTSEAALTWEYAPLEQLQGDPPTPALDTFALGVTLYDLLSGCMPGERERAAGGLPALRTRAPHLAADLAAIVDKATRPELRWRYVHGDDLAQDLEAWLAGAPVAARRPPLVERLVRGARRHPKRLGWVLLATVLLSLVSWAGSWWLSISAAAREAEASMAEGDLTGLGRSLERIPRSMRTAVLRGAADTLVRTLSDANTDSSLPAVLESLRRGDTPEALLLVAQDLRKRGPAAEAVLHAWLVRLIDSIPAERAANRDQLDALRLVARVYHERSVLTPDEHEITQPLRDALRRALNDKPLPAASRHLVWTGLSGCGDGHDAQELIRQACAAGPQQDEARLGLMCATRILLRARPLGLVAALDLDELERLVAPAVAWLGEESQYRPLLRRTTRDLLRLLSMLREERGEEGGLAAKLPATLKGRDPGYRKWSLRELEILVALDRGEAERRWRGGLDHWDAAALGTLTGLLGGEVRRERALAALQGRATQLESSLSWRDEFDAAQLRITADLKGARTPFLPDADTWLGAPASGPSLQSLPLSRSAEPSAFAVWDIAGSLRGGAAGPALLGMGSVEYHAMHDTRVRLGRFGESTVSLPFTVREPPAEDLVLELDHLAARREYLLHGGLVHLLVELDGDLLAEVHLVDSLKTTHSIPVYRMLLHPGDHELTIRCGAESSTTYWLYRVALDQQ